ncbi:MAG: AsmA-like C-terminal domain-containing protein [Pseudomonadota bacterium]
MTLNRRRLYWGIGGALALAMLITSALFLAEAVLNRPATIRQISALATQHMGGPFHFSAVRLSLFFTPHVTLEGVRAYIPGKIGATVREVSAYPSLKGLLTGGVPIGAVRLDTPEIYLTLPQTPTGAPRGTAQSDISAAVSGAVAALASKLPDLEIAVYDGRLTIAGSTFPEIRLENLQARLSVPDGRLVIGCGSAVWKRLQAEVRLDIDTLDVSGDVQLNGVNLAAVADMFPAIPQVSTGETAASLRLRFEGRDTRIATATATLELPAIDVPIPDGVLSLGDIRIAADYIDGPDTRTIHLTTVKLARPKIDARASITTEKKPAAGKPRHQITATADMVDLGSVRSTLNAAMGRHPIVKTVLGIVQGGRASDVTFTVAGDTPNDLGSFEKMTISGRADAAAIQIPGIDLALEEAAGRFLIRSGVLYCEEASARTGSSRGVNGKLQLGLTDGNDVFTLAVAVAVNLPDLPPVLTRILEEKNRQWLKQVTALNGHAAGTLTLGERLSYLHVLVDVSSITGDASIDGLPHSVHISSGKLMVSEKSLTVIDASATMGSALANGVSMKIPFSDPVAEIRADRITLDSADIYSWLVQMPKLASFHGVIGAAAGTVRLEGLDWKGAFDHPRDGLKSLAVSTDALTLSGGALTDAVTLRFRQLRLDHNKATIAKADLRMADAHLAFSGDLNTDTHGLERVDFRVNGSVGDTVFRHLAEGGRLPPQLIINPPLNVTNLRVGWQRSQHVTVTGDLSMGNGPRISIDAALAQEDVNIRSLRVLDPSSDCRFSFRYHKMQIDAGFTGHLNHSTVDRLLADNPFLVGSLEGTATLRLPLENPAGIEMDGHLKGSGVHLPDWMGAPLQVHQLDVRTEGRQVIIDPIDMALLTTRLKASGRASIGADTLEMSLAATADHVDIPRWIAATDAFRGKTPAAQPIDGQQKPARRVNATLNLSIGEVSSGRLKWAPVQAVATITPGTIKMVFSRADICGISHPGRVTLSKDAISAAFTLSAMNQNLNATLNCLHERPVDLTGAFDLSGTISADGPLGNISQILAGDIHLQTSSGRIYHAQTLQDIFSLLNLPGLLDATMGKQKNQGLAYDTMAADILIDNGVVRLEKGVIKGPMMQLAFQGNVGIQDQAIDVTVFVVPLKSIVSVASKIPFIGRILNGDLISIPVKISGTMKNPRYFPLSPDAVGQSAVRILKDIIRLPVDIIQPIIPDSGPGAAPPSPVKEK